MFTKNLFKLSALFVVLTMVLSVSVFAQIYVSATNGDDVIGTGTLANKYSSISKAISVAASGSTIYVEAGTYNATTVRPVQTPGTGEDVLAVTGTKSLTFVATILGIDNNVIITNGININTTGTVSIGQTGEVFNLGTSVTALQLTKGTLNIGATVKVGGTLTVGDGVMVGVPVVTNLNVIFNGANAVGATSAFLPANLGTGSLTVNKLTGALTIDNPTLTVTGISVTNVAPITVSGSLTSKGNINIAAAATVSFNGNVTLGSATAAAACDLINAAAGTVTVGSSSSNTLALYSTVAAASVGTDANVGEIRNTATGKIIINSVVTENIKNTGTATDGGDQTALAITLPVILNTGGSGAAITVNGNINFVNNNVVGSVATNNQVSHTVIIANQGAGTVAIAGTIATPASTAAFTTPDNAHINVQLANIGGGTLSTRGAALRGAAGTAGIVNNTAAGTMTLGQPGDAFTVSYDIVNDFAGSTLTLNGTGTLGGALTNNNATSKVVLGANQTIAGLVTNAGKIQVNSNTLTLSLSAAPALAGAGDIYSATTATTGLGIVKFTGDVGSSTYTGNLPNVEIGCKTSFSLAGNTIWGNLVTSAAGAVTVAGATGVKANLNLNGSATVTINGATTVGADVNMTAGSITLGTAGLTVTGTLNMPQGTFNFGAQTLTLNGNFNRTAGTVTPGTGALVFSGTSAQTFTPGTQMNVNTVTVNNTGLYVAGVVTDRDIVTMTGSLFVLGDFTITSGQVALGTNNIRMDQAAPANTARFTNGGRGYIANGSGGILFEGTGANAAGAGDGAVMTGTKPYSNVFVRLSTPANNVYCLGAVVISGTVTLDGGGIIWGAPADAGDAFNTSTLELSKVLTDPAYPTVVINTINTHPTPFLNTPGATALNISSKYNLSYTGNSSVAIGTSDFDMTTAGNVYNLSIVNGGSGKTITGLATAMEISGSLTIDALETLSLTTTITLSGNTGAHVVNGTVTGGGTVAITGNAATLTGGSGTGNLSSIAAGSFLTVNNAAGTFVSTGMKVLGDVSVTGAAMVASITMNSASASIPGNFTNVSGATALNMNSTASTIAGNVTVTAGSVTLTMNGAAAGTATITGLLNVNGGSLSLGSHIWVTGAVTHAGTSSIALGDYNLTLADNYTHSTSTATFSAGTGAVVAGVSAAATVRTYTLTAAAVIPNFTLNAVVGSGIQLVTSGLEVSNAFIHTLGDLDLNSLPFTVSGNTFKYTAGTYSNTGSAATGVVNLTGSALVISGDGLNPSMQYVVINTAGTAGSVTFNPTTAATPAPRKLTVTQSLTQTKGALNLGINDIEFSAGTGYAFTAGTITATSTGTNIGELIFSGATGFTPGASKSLTIPNLNIGAATTVAGTDSFYVANTLTLATGTLTSAAGRMILNNGALIVRNASTALLSALPTFAGVVDVKYASAALAADITTDKELPADTTKIRNLTVDITAGAGTQVLLGANAKANTQLNLTKGILNLNSKSLTVANGSTVSVVAGSVSAPVTAFGAYNLTYANAAANIAATVNEWPASVTINALTISMGNATGPVNTTLFMAGNRTVTTFTLSCKSDASGIDLTNLAGTSAYSLTVTGLTTLTKGTVFTTITGGTLVAQGNVNASGGSFGALIQMAFTGSNNQVITTPAGGANIGNITIDKATGYNTVQIAGGDLKCSGVVTFKSGLVKTYSANVLELTNAGGLGTGKGYVRNVAAGGKSHVVGNVRQNLQYSTLIAYGRNEFPVGDTANYRPVALTFVNPSASTTVANRFGILATVSHTNARPTGTAGLPIVNGIANGVDLAKYPSFFWSIKTDGPMGNTAFNLDLTADGFNPSEIDLNAVGTNQVKIIRRSGVATDEQNQWNLQGVPDSYDNVVSGGVPTVTAVSADGGLTSAGAIFTYGIKSTLFVLAPIANQNVTAANLVFKQKLTSVFSGNTGLLTYSVSSSNTAIASAAVIGSTADTLKVTGLRTGTSTITVTATDVDNSRITTSFTITVPINVGVEDVTAKIPTEFSLSQNYPNPFNPSTSIKFGLPNQSNVTLKIYNILGEEVANLVNSVMPAGYHTVIFDASKLASGLYIYRIEAGNFVQVKKMMMLK